MVTSGEASRRATASGGGGGGGELLTLLWKGSTWQLGSSSPPRGDFTLSSPSQGPPVSLSLPLGTLCFSLWPAKQEFVLPR